MEIRIIDDNEEFAEKLCNIFSGKYENNCERISLKDENGQSIDIKGFEDIIYTLSEAISKSLPSDNILFINVNLAVQNEKRQNQKGIELLAWLRIKGVMSHCVLYSFQSVDSIVKADIKNLLLFSKGVSFIQLPNDFSAIDLNLLKKTSAEKNNLKTYLKSIFDITTFRHEEANWWSVKALWDVHRIATEGSFADDYPQCIKNNLSDLNKAAGVFLNELDVVNISKNIEEALQPFRIEREKLKERLKGLQRNAENTEENIRYYSEELRDTKEKLSALDKTLQQLTIQNDYQEYIAQQRQSLLADMIFAQTEITNLETAKREIEQIIEIINLHESSLDQIYTEEKKRLFVNPDISGFNREINILLIDDNARNGWESIYQAIFPSAEITSIVPQEDSGEIKDKIEKLYDNEVKPALDEFNKSSSSSLVLLDLRLFNETERSIDIENLSGTLLLEKIRRDFRGIPILMTTASNKIWTFEKLINLGIDAYWIKEGLDEQRTAQDSVENYCRLFTLVDKMTDGRYQILKDFSDYAEKLEQNKNNHWCKQVKWLNGEITAGNIEIISKTLNFSVSILKNYLHNYYLNYGHKGKFNEAFALSGLINKLGGVYENVHAVPPNMVPMNFYNDRGDTALVNIRNLRNRASHIEWVTLKWKDLTNCIDETKKYLDTKQGCEALQIKSAYISNQWLNIECTDGNDYRELSQKAASNTISEEDKVDVEVFKVGNKVDNLTENSRQSIFQLLMQ